MALLFVAEYSDIVQTVRGGTAIPQDPPVVPEYTIPIGGISQQSPAFNPATRFVRLHTDAICSVTVNLPNPTATAANGRFAANQTEFRGVMPGNKLAVITNT
jgi:hypothetical protein